MKQPESILAAASAARVVHMKLMDALSRALEYAKQAQSDPSKLGELVDLGWAMREIHDAADDLRKEAKAKMELVGRVVAMRAAQADVNNEGIGTIHGRVASGLPDVRTEPKIPRPGTPEYLALCEYFGIPRDVAEAGVLAPHYVKLGEWVSNLNRDAKPLPPGLLGTYPKFVTRFTKRRDGEGEEERRKLRAALDVEVEEYVRSLGGDADEF